jgi:nuclear pore complex protein Nup205
MAQAGAGLLEALQDLHGKLVAISERPKDQRIELPQLVGASLDELDPAFKALLDKPPRSKSSRDAVLSGMFHGAAHLLCDS